MTSTEMLKNTPPHLFHEVGYFSMHTVLQWGLLGAVMMYLFVNQMVFCTLTFSCWYFFFQYSITRENAILNHLEKRMTVQKGNVKFQRYLLLLVAKIVHLGKSIRGLYGSVVKYSFTVLIDENPQEKKKIQVIHFPFIQKEQHPIQQEEKPVESIVSTQNKTTKPLSEIEQMLLEAEEMIQDLQGMLPSSCPIKKNVRFCEDVTFYQVSRPTAEEKAWMYYSEVELDSFCEDYFASIMASS
jgi:hypothetical protein